jgi:hypothetical protein
MKNERKFLSIERNSNHENFLLIGMSPAVAFSVQADLGIGNGYGYGNENSRVRLIRRLLLDQFIHCLALIKLITTV